MGADRFSVRAKGKTAQDAFSKAVEEARYEHGHGGYTGTIAEKRSFQMIAPPSGMTPQVFAQAFSDYSRDPAVERATRAVDDKWGPAGCVDLGDGQFFFFGWASS